MFFHLVDAVYVELDLVVHPQHCSFHHAVPEEVGEEEFIWDHVIFDHTGILGKRLFFLFDLFSSLCNIVRTLDLGLDLLVWKRWCR